mmetsp:Transcript_51192/g.128440  ORF Transcript_51192/g.128440 Transcript_51192/m.128440 type:complete len:285 (-) Transcript_51192:1189-2043(-)
MPSRLMLPRPNASWVVECISGSVYRSPTPWMSQMSSLWFDRWYVKCENACGVLRSSFDTYPQLLLCLRYDPDMYRSTQNSGRLGLSIISITNALMKSTFFGGSYELNSLAHCLAYICSSTSWKYKSRCSNSLCDITAQQVRLFFWDLIDTLATYFRASGGLPGGGVRGPSLPCGVRSLFSMEFSGVVSDSCTGTYSSASGGVLARADMGEREGEEGLAGDMVPACPTSIWYANRMPPLANGRGAILTKMGFVVHSARSGQKSKRKARSGAIVEKSGYVGSVKWF